MSSGSIIGSGSVVRGNIRGDGTLEIRGRVEGNVELSGDVLIAEGGAILGNVSAPKITVLGSVQGDLRGSEAVLLEPGGKVIGDLSAPRLGIASGALVRGNVHTEGEPALQGARKPRTPVAAPLPRAAAAPAPRPAATPLAKPAPIAEAARPEPRAEPRSAPVAAAKPTLAMVEGAGRRPPPPVVPALGKGAKAKKKQGRE